MKAVCQFCGYATCRCAPGERQVGGTHYVDLAVQPWDALRAWLSTEEWIGYLRGTALVYLQRFGAKAATGGGDALEDVEKCRHYLEVLAAALGARATATEPTVRLPGAGPQERELPEAWKPWRTVPTTQRDC